MAVQTSQIEEIGTRKSNLVRENQPKTEPRLIPANGMKKMPMDQFREDGNHIQMPQFEENGIRESSLPRGSRHVAKYKRPTVDDGT
jgi:hypothetical protein